MADTPNPVVRRTQILLTAELGTETAATVGALLDDAQLLARPADRIAAGHPVFVRRTGIGAELSVHSLVAALIGALADDVADAGADELAAIAAAAGAERDTLLDDLIDRLGGATLGLGATAARNLGDRLYAAAGPSLPQQLSRKAS